MVISAEEFELMKKRQIEFKEILASAPLEGVDLERDKSYGRDVRAVSYLIDTNVMSELRKAGAMPSQRGGLVCIGTSR